MNGHDADHAALRQSAVGVADISVQACPVAVPLCRLRVTVIGEDGRGVAGIAVALYDGCGGQLRGKTGDDGECRFDGIERGGYRLCLPELDTSAWQLLATAPLDQADQHCDSRAIWEPLLAVAADQPFVHRIVSGECVATIAARYGFFPAAIWEHADNASLRAERDSLYVLAPGDLVRVPVRTARVLPVEAGSRVTLKRLGVPERLRIRFLDGDDTPRAGLRYLLSVDTGSGTLTEVLTGVTDAAGFVDATIPPDATSAEIVFTDGAVREVHRFGLSRLEPANTRAGWVGRLRNLGYLVGAADMVSDAALELAIADFQRDRRLPVTGTMDGPTVEVLHALALS